MTALPATSPVTQNVPHAPGRSGLGAGDLALVEDLDAALRSLVRREGVDPQSEVPTVRRLATSVVREHDDRALTGAVAAVVDAEALVSELVARVAGFGPLQPLLDDPEIEEVWINEPSRVFVARSGRHELTNLRLTRTQVDELVERMLKSSGRRIDLSRPFVDAMLPDGHRLHVVLEGISRGFSAVNVRKFVLRAARTSDLVELGSLTPQAAAFLEASVRAGLNILVAGGTQAGKTTMLNALAAAIPGGERVITAEEVFELRFAHPDWVAMQTRQAGLEGTGEVTLRDLVKEALRMRPNRLIVGEVRASECLDLVLALNAGLPGMCTLHANSAREALLKMCTLPLLAGENISSRFVVPTVATSVDLVVHLGLDPRGRRQVEEIVAVPGRVEGDVIETEPVFVRRGGELVRAHGTPPRPERFERVRIDVHALLAGGSEGVS
ncbi:CpaF family protein [Nocardioides sp. GY 10127]|nr:CpaF family protein [Nocardioides sp. GY 10127]